MNSHSKKERNDKMVLSEDKTHLLAIEEKDIGSGGILKIPEGVTLIGHNVAGDGFLNLKSVFCPSTLKSIGTGAFKDCTRLTTFMLKKPEALLRVGSNAFEGCVSLRAFPFEKTESLETIGMSAFRGTGLIHIDFNSHGPNLIQANAFSHCENLLWANLGAQLKFLGDYCLANNNLLRKVSILSESITTIENFVFCDCPNFEKLACYGNPKNLTNKSFEGVNIQQLKTKNHTFSLPETSTEIIRMFLKESNSEE